MTEQKLKFTVNPTRLTILLLAAAFDRQEAENTLALMRTLPFIHLELKQYFDEDVHTSLARLSPEVADLVYKSINIGEMRGSYEPSYQINYNREIDLEVYYHVVATLMNNHGLLYVRKDRIHTDELDKLFVQTVCQIADKALMMGGMPNENLIIAMGSMWLEVGLIIGEKLQSLCDIKMSQKKDHKTTPDAHDDTEEDDSLDAKQVTCFNNRFNHLGFKLTNQDSTIRDPAIIESDWNRPSGVSGLT